MLAIVASNIKSVFDVAEMSIEVGREPIERSKK